MAYGLNHWRENANILVYDLGGGTFDVTLVHMGKNGVLSTITTRGNHNHYYNEIIIPANHPRPVRAAKKFRFYTSPQATNELAIYVLQGDSENPLDCQITYKYVVTGIKHVNRGGKIGTVIRIQYSYDVNGIIHIQARQEDSKVRSRER